MSSEPLHRHHPPLPPPHSYALDVNLASLDVLNHKRLLDSARADPSAVSFQVRPVDVAPAPASATAATALARAPSFSASESLLSEAAALTGRAVGRRGLPRPAFGSSPNLQVRGEQAANGGSGRGWCVCGAAGGCLLSRLASWRLAPWFWGEAAAVGRRGACLGRARGGSDVARTLFVLFAGER